MTIQRAIIHVEGPEGGGKTTFVEALLESTDDWLLAARGVRDDALEEPEESAPRDDPELERYRRAGAEGVARFRFPGDPGFGDELFMSDLLEEPSDALVIEGHSPLEWVDLRVFVAAAPPAGSRLFVRRKRNRAKEEREKASAMEKAMQTPGGAAAFLAREFGPQMADIAQRSPDVLEDFRSAILKGVEEARARPAPAPTRYWAVSRRYAGIERGQLVVITVRDEAERSRAQGLVDQLGRLRKEDELFDDILGPWGKKTPVTAVAADLRDPKDPGRRKAMARARRTLRANRD